MAQALLGPGAAEPGACDAHGPAACQIQDPPPHTHTPDCPALRHCGAGTTAGGLLVDGLGDGAMIEAPHEDLDFLRTTSFGLLQVGRATAACQRLPPLATLDAPQAASGRHRAGRAAAASACHQRSPPPPPSNTPTPHHTTPHHTTPHHTTPHHTTPHHTTPHHTTPHHTTTTTTTLTPPQPPPIHPPPQGSRMRNIKTEYVSCPSCGRTLFDLQEVTEQIRTRTGHLPGVAIAIMGCIVNGPGEMADADFGYVGGAPGGRRGAVLGDWAGTHRGGGCTRRRGGREEGDCAGSSAGLRPAARGPRPGCPGRPAALGAAANPSSPVSDREKVSWLRPGWASSAGGWGHPARPASTPPRSCLRPRRRQDRPVREEGRRQARHPHGDRL
jgi:hypothetical protein